MKHLYKVEHKGYGKIRAVKIVARSAEEAKTKIFERFGELDIVRIREIQIEKAIQDTLNSIEKLMEKIQQKTNAIVNFKVSLLEYRSLNHQLSKLPNYHCYRVKRETKEGTLSNHKYVALNPQHALDLFNWEYVGSDRSQEGAILEELIVPYQIHQIESYIEKIKRNMEKDMDTVARFRRTVWELQLFKKQIKLYKNN